MPNEYTLADLAKIAGVTPRTIRFYIEQGLLPAPTQLGQGARYTETHLERLRLIKKLRAGYLPLADIRNRIRALSDDQIAAASQPEQPEPPGLPQRAAVPTAPASAVDYIRGVLGNRPARVAASAAAVYQASAPATTAPATAPVATGASKPSPEPDRSQWERISLDPDVELHIRRPLTRPLNKRVERLIRIARQLMEDDL